MDVIERVFHLSPDGGSGLLEWSLVLLAFLIVVAPFVIRPGDAWRRS